MSTRSTAAAAAAGGGAARRGRGHKERSKNFTELEKRTVLELIARHRDVLRQGRSNNATNKNKQLVWSTICEEVNLRCAGERPRTPAQVKMWYENYKKKCKMRAADPPPQEGPSILDGMLWQNLHPLDVKDDDHEQETMESGSVISGKEEECLPVNMSNGRLSSCNDSSDTLTNVLEPHVQITARSPAAPSPPPPPAHPPHPHHPPHPLQRLLTAHDAAAPLNLCHPDESRRGEAAPRARAAPARAPADGGATDEERLYYAARRQHATWEHEAKMRILSVELRQKEEIFSLQKQLFLIELKLKMDFLEKACAK